MAILPEFFIAVRFSVYFTAIPYYLIDVRNPMSYLNPTKAEIAELVLAQTELAA